MKILGGIGIGVAAICGLIAFGAIGQAMSMQQQVDNFSTVTNIANDISGVSETNRHNIDSLLGFGVLSLFAALFSLLIGLGFISAAKLFKPPAPVLPQGVSPFMPPHGYVVVQPAPPPTPSQNQ